MTMTIAQTILQQIGGKRFITMTGSNNFMDLGNALRMNLTRNKTQANRLKIELDEALDLYNVVFYRQVVTKTFDVKITEIAKYEGVYCDMLEDIFTETTGLYTRL